MATIEKVKVEFTENCEIWTKGQKVDFDKKSASVLVNVEKVAKYVTTKKAE